MCFCDYSERMVASFAHQIQSEYYGGNMYVSIEVIPLEHFREPKNTETEGTPQAHTSNVVFHSLLSDDRKKGSSKNIAHKNCIVELLKQRNIMYNTLSTIWKIYIWLC